MRKRLICLVCLALVSTFSFAQQKAPPSGRGMDQPSIPSICDNIGANFLTNCGFETGDFGSWDLTGPTDYTFIDSGDITNSGDWGAAFGPIGEFNRLTKTGPTNVGGRYHVEFWLANTLGGTGTFFGADFADQALMVLEDGSAPFEYTLFTFGPLVATEEFSTLGFIFRHDPWFWYFDDVDLEPQSAVPSGTARK